jgi:hypothetical protein
VLRMSSSLVSDREVHRYAPASPRSNAAEPRHHLPALGRAVTLKRRLLTMIRSGGGEEKRPAWCRHRCQGRGTGHPTRPARPGRIVSRCASRCAAIA